MAIHKLTNTNAFVAFDLEDAPAAGIVRTAPKILQGGAKDMARSQTYAFASLEMKRGGASAGINADAEQADDAIAAFAAELAPMAQDGALSLDAGKGVRPAQLEVLAAADDRSALGTEDVDGDPLAVHLAALGPVLSAEAVLGGLDSKTVAIEGFGAAGPALAAAVTARGATVRAVSTTKGLMTADNGFDPVELRELWNDSGAGMVGSDPDPAWKIFGAEVDCLFVGSKIGAVNHETADGLGCQVLVPHAPLPYTARALAVMARGDIVAVPDFIAIAAPALAWWPIGEATAQAAINGASEALKQSISETIDHNDGLFLGACYRAESFLASWRDEVPFGRPLAS